MRFHSASTHAAKLSWLTTHPDQWAWTEGAVNKDPRWRELFEAMRVAGLYSHRTYWRDVSLGKLVVDARREMRRM